MVAESPTQLLPHLYLLLTDRGVPPITVLVLSSTSRAVPPVQDGPLWVVRHWIIDGAEVGKEVKVLQDVARQFGLVKKQQNMLIDNYEVQIAPYFGYSINMSVSTGS